jgi:hypothetical protein
MIDRQTTEKMAALDWSDEEEITLEIPPGSEELDTFTWEWNGTAWVPVNE